ncbi:hypothetical protein [Psychrobacter sp. CAL346-MNA-CIBAN-0220]
MTDKAAITNTNATIVGQLCTPKDVLAQNQGIEELRIGTILFSL